MKHLTEDRDMTRTITMRVKESNLHFIEKVASLSGRNRTEFFLESTLKIAEEIFLSRTQFPLDDAQWTELNDILDRPAKENLQLKKLLQKQSPWET